MALAKGPGVPDFDLCAFSPCRLKNHYLLNHPHVVKLKDVFVTSQHLNIVLELAESGMLFEYVNKRLRENNGQMREDDAR
jgi:serine/threonine-protein kinase SRK2